MLESKNPPPTWLFTVMAMSRRWKLVVASVAVAAVLGAFMAHVFPPKYRATIRLMALQRDKADPRGSEARPETYSLIEIQALQGILQTAGAQKKLSQALPEGQEWELLTRWESGLLNISVICSDSAAATAVLNAGVSELSQVAYRLRLIDDSNLAMPEGSGTPRFERVLRVMEPATTKLIGNGVSAPAVTLLFAILGLIFSAVLSFLIEWSRSTGGFSRLLKDLRTS